MPSPDQTSPLDKNVLARIAKAGEEMRKSRFGGVTTAEFDILNAKLDTLIREVRNLKPTSSVLITGQAAITEYKRLKGES